MTYAQGIHFGVKEWHIAILILLSSLILAG
jgi:hypothetical protein